MSRHSFIDLFLAAFTGVNEIPVLLKGWNGHKLTGYNPTIYSCDLIETFGKVVAHSIVLTGLGLSYLAYAVYICIGKIESTVPYLVIAEATCQQTKE